ncbi:MAG: purine-nucleoside phosphorylase, partial [Clostridiales bacterium]|nr:purine-nucleoside phosphorylase [Clostridiales bacterium]
IEDHISSFVPSPLAGENDDSLGPRFPDMSEVYSKRLNKIIAGSALKNNINIKKGVYIQLPGPAFETKAEIKMCAALGADAVGMSTAIEAQAAKYCGFEICAVSCITNLACGLLNKPITSDEVNETAERTYDKFKNLLIDTLGNISNEQY